MRITNIYHIRPIQIERGRREGKQRGSILSWAVVACFLMPSFSGCIRKTASPCCSSSPAGRQSHCRYGFLPVCSLRVTIVSPFLRYNLLVVVEGGKSTSIIRYSTVHLTKRSSALHSLPSPSPSPSLHFHPVLLLSSLPYFPSPSDNISQSLISSLLGDQGQNLSDQETHQFFDHATSQRQRRGKWR